MPFTKLDAAIIHSSIWDQPHHVVRLWITLLAMQDKDGVVKASRSGLANASRLSSEELEEALGILMSPDPESPDDEFEGRRLAEHRGCFVVLKAKEYRERRSREKEADAARAKAYRARKRAHSGTDECRHDASRRDDERHGASQNLSDLISSDLICDGGAGEEAPAAEPETAAKPKHTPPTDRPGDRKRKLWADVEALKERLVYEVGAPKGHDGLRGIVTRPQDAEPWLDAGHTVDAIVEAARWLRDEISDGRIAPKYWRWFWTKWLSCFLEKRRPEDRNAPTPHVSYTRDPENRPTNLPEIPNGSKYVPGVGIVLA